jgi:hypothetical protein
VGSGGANAPEDVVAAKRALAASGRYGHDRTRPPSPYTDEAMVEAVRSLQRDHGLFENGTLDPRDPAVQLLLKEAEDGVRGVFPPSVAEKGEGETQTAALPFLIPLAIAGARVAAPHIARWAAPHIARLAGGAAARTAAPNAAKSILGAAAAGALGQAANETGKRAGTQQRTQTDIENAQIPPYPGEPLDPFPPFVTPIPDERGPSVTTTPIPKPAKAEIETYPAEEPRMPDKFIYQALEDEDFMRRMNILFNMRGNRQTQDLDDDTGHDVIAVGQELGLDLEFIGGGFLDRNTREFWKQYWLRPQDHLRVPEDKTKRKNGSFVDVVVRDRKTGRILLLNTTTNRADGSLTPGEEWQRTKIMVNKEEDMGFAAVEKARKGVDPSEHRKQLQSKLRKIVEEFFLP